ncbi:MAG: PKD domain-containing protein [Pseudoxanthomonas sp.]|nr:PKD domain-containing protein [Pseudoxanthomonas sp.]
MEARIEPSRSQCVAPCAILFDASPSSSPSPDVDAFTDLEYLWDFGDPGAGTWSLGAWPMPKNRAVGPIAGHVFERAGSFQVTVRVSAPDGVSALASRVIQVADPDLVFAGLATTCVAVDDDGWQGCPAGARRLVAQDATSAWDAHGGPGRRVLLRRGDQFEAPAPITAAGQGPGQLGAFGSGPRPVLSQGLGATCLRVGSTGQPTSDFSFRHLHCRKPAAASADFSGALTTHPFSTVQAIEHILFADIDAQSYGSLQGWPLDGALPREHVSHLFLYEVRDLPPHTPGQFIINFPFGRGLAWLGVRIDRQAQTDCTGTTSAFRTSTIQRSVISQVEFMHTCTGPLRIHSTPSADPDRMRPEKIVVTGSRIGPLNTAGAFGSNGGPVSLDPGVGPGDQVRDFVFEGNLVLYSANNNNGFDWSGRNFVARNNVFDLRGAPGGGGAYAVFVKNGGDHGSTSRIRFLHNTVYQLQGQAGSWHGAFTSSEGAGDVAVANNALRTTGGTAGGQLAAGDIAWSLGNVVAGPAVPEPLLAALPSTAALEGFCPRPGGAFDGGAAAAQGVADLFLRPRDADSPSPGACEVRVDLLFADGFEG